MKRLWMSVLIMALCGSGVWLLNSCAKQQGPLSPDTGLVGLNNGGAKDLPSVSANVGTTLATNQNYWIEFDTAMDPASLTSSTVRISKMDSATAESSVTVRLSYDKTIKRLTISPDSGSWDNDDIYHVLLTTGVKSVSGRPLDGNENNVAENSAFDNYHTSFEVGTATTPGYDFSALQLSSVDVEAGNAYFGDLATTPYALGNVPVQYAYVTITVRFNKSYEMDTVYQNSNTLRANAFEFYNMTDRANVSPREVIAGANWNSITAVFDLISQGAKNKYRFKIKGGLNGPRASTDLDDTRPLIGGCYFSGGDTIAEANDEAVGYIETADADGNTITYPEVSSADYPDTDPVDANSRRWTVAFNKAMNPSTLTTGNIKISVAYWNWGLTATYYTINPKKLLYDPLTYVLYVYLPDSFYPFDTTEDSDFLTVQLIVGRNVMSADGYKLDTSADEVPGMDDDDYESAVDSVRSKLQ